MEEEEVSLVTWSVRVVVQAPHGLRWYHREKGACYYLVEMKVLAPLFSLMWHHSCWGVKVPSLHMEKNILDSELGFCWYRWSGASFLSVDFGFFPGYLDKIRLSVCVRVCLYVFSHYQSLLLQAIDEAKRKPRELTTVSLVPWFPSFVVSLPFLPHSVFSCLFSI